MLRCEIHFYENVAGIVLVDKSGVRGVYEAHTNIDKLELDWASASASFDKLKMHAQSFRSDMAEMRRKDSNNFQSTQPSEQHEFVWWTCKKCTSLDGMHSFFLESSESQAQQILEPSTICIFELLGENEQDNWETRNITHTHTQWHLKSCMQHHHIDDWVLWMCQIDIKSHSMTETNELHNQNRRFDLYSSSILLTFSRVCLNRFVFCFQCIHWKWIPNMHCCMLIQIRCEARISEDLVS